jgi:hypothetical protein
MLRRWIVFGSAAALLAVVWTGASLAERQRKGSKPAQRKWIELTEAQAKTLDQLIVSRKPMGKVQRKRVTTEAGKPAMMSRRTFQIQVKVGGQTFQSLSAVSCTASCDGGCSPSGCEPGSDGYCTHPSCDGACGVSCSRTTSVADSQLAEALETATP